MYRGLTKEEFENVKNEAAIICEEKGLMTIGDFKRIGNEIIDKMLESKKANGGKCGE